MLSKLCKTEKKKRGTQFYNCEADEESRTVLPGEREGRGEKGRGRGRKGDMEMDASDGDRTTLKSSQLPNYI